MVKQDPRILILHFNQSKITKPKKSTVQKAFLSVGSYFLVERVTPPIFRPNNRPNNQGRRDKLATHDQRLTSLYFQGSLKKAKAQACCCLTPPSPNRELTGTALPLPLPLALVLAPVLALALANAHTFTLESNSSHTISLFFYIKESS